MSKNKQLIDSISMFGGFKPSQVPSSAVNSSQLPTANSESNHGLMGENEPSQLPRQQVRTVANAQLDNDIIAVIKTNSILASPQVSKSANPHSQYYGKKQISKDVKKSVSVNYDINDRLDLFIRAYNREHRSREDFQNMDFQNLAIIAIDEFLKKMGY